MTAAAPGTWPDRRSHQRWLRDEALRRAVVRGHTVSDGMLIGDAWFAHCSTCLLYASVEPTGLGDEIRGAAVAMPCRGLPAGHRKAKGKK